MEDPKHPRLDLDEKLLNPLRLSLVSALTNSEGVSFKEMRDFLQTTDSTLSKHASALEEAGYIAIKKGYVGVRPNTVLALTKAGYAAWKAHVTALQAVATASSVPEESA